MKTLPLGSAYVVWTGIGSAGAFLVGIAVLGEAATPMRVLAAALILLGIVMMKISSPS
jgi:quaternary ammonium compound-resistance protein SugE